MKFILWFLFAIIGIAIATDTTVNSKVEASSKALNSVHVESKNQVQTNSQIQSQLKNKVLTKSKSEKAKSVMEFMNEINSDKPKKNIKKKVNKKRKMKNKKKKAKKIKKIKIRRKTFKDPIKVILSGWLKVSTANFRKNSRFPELILPNKKKIHIDNTKNYFRINTDYHPSKKGDSLPPSKFDFWFRLSGKNLYYATNKKSINVLGVISVKHMIDAVSQDKFSKNTNCFKVNDRSNTNWLLCAPSVQLRDKWVCKIKDILGLPTKDCRTRKTSSKGGKNKVIYKKIIKPVIYIPVASRTCNENWNYSLKGDDWNCDCSEGKMQSPIDLPPLKYAIDSPVKPLFQYKEVNKNSKSNNDPDNHSKRLRLEYSDSALRIKHSNFGRIVTLDGAVFAAKEIVFHTPSEHTIDGRRFDMEMQIIHHGQTRGDIARQVIVSFLFQKKAGVRNKFIDEIDVFDLPNPLNNVKELHNAVNINSLFYQVKDKEYSSFKPFSFYTYHGSITAPPCTENTIVYVASKPLRIGTTALQMFQEVGRIPDPVGSSAIANNYNVPNNRKIQPLNGRAVFYFDHIKHCGMDPSDKKKKRKENPVGHYEKVIKKRTDYFFVEGLNPSGLPGAYVVSDKEALGKK
jgi:carbonic anhydrase